MKAALAAPRKSGRGEGQSHLPQTPILYVRGVARAWDALALGYIAAHAASPRRTRHSSGTPGLSRRFRAKLEIRILPASQYFGSLLPLFAEQKFGRGRIRTHEPLRVSCFQDRRNRPLCHSSKKNPKFKGVG